MPYRAHARRQRRRARRLHEPARHASHSRRSVWQAALGVAAAIIALILVLSAWGGDHPVSPLGTMATSGEGSLVGGPLAPMVVARAGGLPIDLPVARAAVTAIGYHSVPDTIALSPEGTQVNEGLLARFFHRISGSGGSGLNYYELSGGSGTHNGALDIGAAPETDVYAPVDGKVVQIGPYIINGRHCGVRLDIRPDTDASVIVSMTRISGDRTLKIGSPLQAGHTRVGSIIDLSRLEQQKLAQYTQDAGNHVTIDVESAAVSIMP
ncbi:MAG: hypothetical protein WBQ14_07585 [Gaiellaceae bacterium]